MEPHKPILLRALALELDLMGERADLKPRNLAHTPREMFAMSAEYLNGTRPALRDVLHPISKTREALADDGGKLETTLRLIDLETRIAREWNLI